VEEHNRRLNGSEYREIKGRGGKEPDFFIVFT
jgi:hypothetical protein